MAKIKLGKVNERAIFLSIVILLAIFLLGTLFIANPQMTGQVVIGGLNQSECVTEGYIWEDIINETETCTNEIIYLNVTYDCEPCLEPEVINETSGDCVSWSSCINETSTEEETCVNEVIGNQCTGDICDTDHLNLCDETNCTDATGYWYDDVCNAEEEPSCVPDTCDSLSSDCGTFDDGCGGTLDCGECAIPTKAPLKEVKSSCVSQWECEIWGECVDGTQTRTCEDTRNCVLKEGEPSLSQACKVIIEETEVIIEETCFDKKKNQDEEGIDCGGVCEERCSVFTMVGSVVSGPIESGKEFFQQNKTMVFVISGILVLALSGFLTFGVLKKKGVLPKILPKIQMLFRKNLEKFKGTS